MACNWNLLYKGCNWQLSYSLLQLASFACTFENDYANETVCMHIAIDNCCMHYCSWQILYVSLQLATFICISDIQDNFCMYCYNWKCFCNNIANLVCDLVIDNFLCSNAIENCCMLYSNCGISYFVKTTSWSSAISIITTTVP